MLIKPHKIFELSAEGEVDYIKREQITILGPPWWVRNYDLRKDTFTKKTLSQSKWPLKPPPCISVNIIYLEEVKERNMLHKFPEVI